MREQRFGRARGGRRERAAEWHIASIRRTSQPGGSISRSTRCREAQKNPAGAALGAKIADDVRRPRNAGCPDARNRNQDAFRETAAETYATPNQQPAFARNGARDARDSPLRHPCLCVDRSSESQGSSGSRPIERGCGPRDHNWVASGSRVAAPVRPHRSHQQRVNGTGCFCYRRRRRAGLHARRGAGCIATRGLRSTSTVERDG